MPGRPTSCGHFDALSYGRETHLRLSDTPVSQKNLTQEWDDDEWEEYDEEEESGGLVSFLAKSVLTAGVATAGYYGAQFAIK